MSATPSVSATIPAGDCSLIPPTRAAELIGPVIKQTDASSADEIAATATKVDVCEYKGSPVSVGYAVGKFTTTSAAVSGMAAEAGKQAAKHSTPFSPAGLTSHADGFIQQVGPITLVSVIFPIGTYGVVTIASGSDTAAAKKAALAAAKILLTELQ